MTLLLLLAGCLDHEPLPGESGGTYVAMQADFAGYEGWTAFDATGEVDGHAGETRTVYIDPLPSGGEPAFAVGTRIVKVTELSAQGGAADLEIHAMAKRGDGYNTEGAVGWEWFELALAEDGTPVIDWRGAAPPSGSGYGSFEPADTAAGAEGDCNGCHTAAYANDFVHTVPL